MKKSLEKKEYILEYDLTFVNILSIILLVAMVALTIILLNILPPSLTENIITKFISIKSEDNFTFLYAIFFVGMILWMVLHEIIHSIAYQMTGAKSENIVFGVALEKGVFYCKCKEYINKKCIITSLLSPFIIIGLITYILGFICNSPWLIVLSIINISGASGDLMMFSFFLKQHDDIEFKELGYSSPFCLRTTDELTSKKFIGIKSIKEVTNPKETEEGPEKKITITKGSWIFIIVMIVLLGLMIGLEYLNDNTVKSGKSQGNSDRFQEDFEINKKAYELVKSYSLKNVSWDINEDNIIKEFPELTFKKTSDAKTDDNIYIKKDNEERKIIYGCPIISTYKYDLTGDGKPEIIANVGFGYGISDSHIEVYDLYNDKKYFLWDRGEYDYFLYYVDNEFKIIKLGYERSKGEAFHGNLKFVIDEENSDERYLTIENEEEL